MDAESPGLIRAISTEVAELHAERLMTGDFGALLRSLDARGKRSQACCSISTHHELIVWQCIGGLDASVLVLLFSDSEELG